MGTNTGKVREFCQSGKVGTLKTGKSRICDHLPFEGMCPKIQVDILLYDVGKSIVVK